MVLCRALCAAAAVVTTISATATGSYAPPDHANFTIPSYDLSSPHDHAGLVQSLQTHGIVALRSVPAFAESRAAYVQAAYTCMRDHPTLEALLHKQLQDGTERTTISTHADGSVGGYSAVLDVHCPQLSLTHKSYGDVLHSASLQLARVLSETVESPPSSLLDAVVRGAHLDHVHRYTSPSSKSSFPATAAASSVMSLDFHTDNGLFLLTSAPFYFDATDGHAVADAPSGLVLQLSLDGVPTQVRPRLVHDELVVMVGEGYTRWGSYGHSFPAVLHAMQMPLAATAVRMFAGRMLLLPKDATLAHTNLTFQAYAEASTRFALNEPATDHDRTILATLGCPVGRSLLASDLSCALGIWTPSNQSDPSTTKAQCMAHCNAPNMKKDVEMCQSLKCIRTSEIPDGGTECWMLCVQHLDQCAVADQVCVDQTLVCPAATSPHQQQSWEWPVIAAAAAAVVVLALVVWSLRKRRHATEEKVPLLLASQGMNVTH